MPVIILGTQMQAGDIKWRPTTTGLIGAGPEDRTLMIQFHGNPVDLVGFDGQSLNIAEFRDFCSLAQQDWVPATGTFPCTVTVGVGIPILVTVVFNQ